jgi:hypothetical protein
MIEQLKKDVVEFSVKFPLPGVPDTVRFLALFSLGSPPPLSVSLFSGPFSLDLVATRRFRNADSRAAAFCFLTFSASLPPLLVLHQATCRLLDCSLTLLLLLLPLPYSPASLDLSWFSLPFSFRFIFFSFAFGFVSTPYHDQKDLVSERISPCLGLRSQ